MNVPGSNLLGIALTVLTAQLPRYYAYNGNAVSPSGKEVPTYAAAVTRRGSFQPLSRDNVERLGLEMAKSYATFYGPGAVRTLERDGAPDQFGFAGRRYDALGLMDWQTQDGWTAALLVDVGADA